MGPSSSKPYFLRKTHYVISGSLSQVHYHHTHILFFSLPDHLSFLCAKLPLCLRWFQRLPSIITDISQPLTSISLGSPMSYSMLTSGSLIVATLTLSPFPRFCKWRFNINHNFTHFYRHNSSCFPDGYSTPPNPTALCCIPSYSPLQPLNHNSILAISTPLLSLIYNHNHNLIF